MKILYRFATRSRPERFFKCLDNMFAMMTHDDFIISVTCDVDDQTMHPLQINHRLLTYPNTTITYGISQGKVSAINRDTWLTTDWTILINMSDDMEFIVPGFDLQILRDYATLPVGDVLMHYPDGHAGQALITMAIMDRKYFDRFGYIYNPEYKSLFCDNEQHEVAVKLGRYKYFKKQLFVHNHPAWPGNGSPDALMIHTESFYHEDEATFKRRKAENFGL